METERIALLSKEERSASPAQKQNQKQNQAKLYGSSGKKTSFDVESSGSSASSSSDHDQDTTCTCTPGGGDRCYFCHQRANAEQQQRQKVAAVAAGGNRHLSITVLDSDSGEHCHDDEIQREIDKKARKKLWMASGLCVVFMIAEAAGGILAGSLAVATDAAHLLTDFAGFMISLFALYISERPATKRLSYGYHRAEVIGALTSVLLIWVVTGILVFMATQRLISQDFEIDAPIMLITSGVGLIVNIIMGCTLHQHAHSHGGGGGHSHGGGGGSGHGHGGHGHSHGGGGGGGHSQKEPKSYQNGGYTNPIATGNLDMELGEGNAEENCTGVSSSTSSASLDAPAVAVTHKQNVNVRAAFIHVVGDFIQSVGVFAAAIIIYFKPNWAMVDPICTYLFSVLVLGTTYAIVKDTLVVLMEGIPKGIDFNDVRETLLHVKGVCKVHNLRIWSLSMDRIALSAHLAIDPNASGRSRSSSDILRKSSQLVKTKYGFSEVTIQIEDFTDKMQDCRKCQELN